MDLGLFEEGILKMEDYFKKVRPSQKNPCFNIGKKVTGYSKLPKTIRYHK